MSSSVRLHRWQPTRLLHPWDFPGKSTGVGCHCLLWIIMLMCFKWYINFQVIKRHLPKSEGLAPIWEVSVLQQMNFIYLCLLWCDTFWLILPFYFTFHVPCIFLGPFTSFSLDSIKICFLHFLCFLLYWSKHYTFYMIL